MADGGEHRRLVDIGLTRAGMTTLNTDRQLWPGSDESSRAAVAVALAAREDSGGSRPEDNGGPTSVSAGQHP